MPHISIEATPRLAAALDFRSVFAAIHHRLADEGHGKLDDFKSRVHVTATHLAGDDPDGEILVARLMTTNPRPADVQRAMAQTIHDLLTAAIETELRPYWWQCCVLNEPFERADYFKTDSQGGGANS
ncbi:hypothetical protein [Sphingomonas sp.]|uniref:hypothetical protein n=1 Tax=Sphingomonas sp. TaxID=28214 RepID=UPI003D6D75E3